MPSELEVERVQRNLSARTRVAAGVIVAVLVTAGATWALSVRQNEAAITLPDRNDPAVVAEEERLGDLIDDSGAISAGSNCAVELVRQEGPVSYAWADCISTPDGTSVDVVLPVRISGTTVEYPAAPTYADDFARLFPPDADKALTLARPGP